MSKSISSAWIVAWIGVLSLSGVASAIPGSGGDDFDDGIVDPARWGTSIIDGAGLVNETNGRLEYSAPTSPTSFDQVYYYWQGSSPTFGSSWGMWLDLHNEALPNEADQVAGFGLFAENANDPNDYIYSEMYASQLVAPPLRRGFYTEAVTNGVSNGYGDSGSLFLGGDPEAASITDGALQILYYADTGRIRSYFSLTGGWEDDWVLFSDFGIAGAASGDPEEDWDMASSDHFNLGIYGYSFNEVIVSGEIWGDNFTMLNSPEPSSGLLVAFGLAAVALVRRSRRQI